MSINEVVQKNAKVDVHQLKDGRILLKGIRENSGKRQKSVLGSPVLTKKVRVTRYDIDSE